MNSEHASLSVCIITFQEAERLERCLRSVADIATQIVVLDSLSTDATCEIARAAGADVHTQPFAGHVRQKQAAMDLATCEWVLSIDADEWLDEAARAAVGQVLREPPEQVDGFRLNRRPYYLGRWIAHSGWSPDWKLRLVRRDRARWRGIDPHDRLEVPGATRRLRGRLCHAPHPDLSDHVRTLNQYTDILTVSESVGALRAWFGMVVEPPLVLLQKYVLQGGFLEGTRGLIISAMTAFYFFLRYAKHWERRHRRDRP